MKYKLKNGIEFDAVPKIAYCYRVHKNIIGMKKCPIKQGDKKGEFCVPDGCAYYGEEPTEDEQP